MRLGSRKELVFGIVALCLGVIMFALGLEIALRFLPVSEGLRTIPVNDANPIARFEPNRTSVSSRGWDFKRPHETQTNNVGYVSDRDYEPDGEGPLIAIIGDSYVQAGYLAYAETAAGRLANHLERTARVYSFGVSGAPLSQYLAFAEYARDTFRPDRVVFIVAGNDFDESLAKYKTAPGFHYFVESDDGQLELERVDFSVNVVRRLVRTSALARYLLIHLEIRDLAKRTWSKLSKSGASAQYVGNTSAEADSVRVADSRRGVDAFLDRLPTMSGLDSSRVMFAIDGMRPHLYDADSLGMARGSFVDSMRKYLIEVVRSRGYEIVDLQQVFGDHFSRHGERFEYAFDNHWNSLGNELLFQSLANSKCLEEFSGAVPVSTEWP